MYKITTLETAFDDLKEIKQYLSRFYPGTVRRFVLSFKTVRASLKEFPFAYPVYEDDKDYRKAVFGDYLLFYIVNEATQTVELHRILHGARDISKHLSRQ